MYIKTSALEVCNSCLWFALRILLKLALRWLSSRETDG